MTFLTSHHTLPPFPNDIPTAPLVTLSLEKLLSKDNKESEAFFKAAQDLGFFYLDLKDCPQGQELIASSEELRELAVRFFNLPRAEKEKYSQEKIGPFYAWRFKDSEELDSDGNKKYNEGYNIKKDDILGLANPRTPAPEMILDNEAALARYVKACRKIIDNLLEHLETHLQLPAGTLAELHRVDAPSGDHVRFNQTPPMAYSLERARGGEHTDFGSLTILFNWLGGLQIRLPDTADEWVWVKPVPGCAVINLGDALVKFTAGILRSNIHRVVPPPGEQAGLKRQSLVYFSRPEDDVVLKRLKGGLIDAQPVQDEGELITSKDWILRRSGGDLRGVYTHKAGLEPRGSAYI